MSFIVLIGARGGSKRIPKKNLIQIGEHTLIGWAIHYGMKLGNTFVSSDSEEILDVARMYGACTIKRPSELASDTATDFDWISHAVKCMSNSRLLKDEIVFLRPTTPFRDEKVLRDAIEDFDPSFDSMRSIEELKEPIQKTVTIAANKMICPAFPNLDNDGINAPSASFPPSFSTNGYIDIIKPEIVREGSIYGERMQGFITPHSVDIDTIQDLEYAKFIANKKS